MLILILIDVQYSQKAVFNFEKDSNCPIKISDPKIFVNSPLAKNINLVVRPTKSKWKMHALFRQRVVDLSFVVIHTSKNKASFWFCRINFDYYEKFCWKMFFYLFSFEYIKKEKYTQKITLMPNYSLVMYFMIWTFHIFSSSTKENIHTNVGLLLKYGLRPWTRTLKNLVAKKLSILKNLGNSWIHKKYCKVA